ncbi:MAG: acetyltransferase [Chloroflexi bacterium]|nr:acetyltransferase [Chloroflexota bacterium]
MDTPVVEAANGLRIRLLRDAGEDYELLTHWLSDERVLEFIFGRDNPFDYHKVVQKYGPRAEGRNRVVACILEQAGQPLGYLQFYAVDDATEYSLESAEGVYGVDLFIGEPEQWNKGIGTAVLEALTQYLFEGPGVTRIVIDPRVTNSRAIRCYEKCGFRCEKVLPRHELHEGEWRDCWLMVKVRP